MVKQMTRLGEMKKKFLRISVVEFKHKKIFYLFFLFLFSLEKKPNLKCLTLVSRKVNFYFYMKKKKLLS